MSILLGSDRKDEPVYPDEVDRATYALAYDAGFGAGAEAARFNMPRDRDLWTPEFEVHHEVAMGEEWPVVIVTKWEVNRIGERRFVGTRALNVGQRTSEP